jgi:hypothetical protein
MLLLMMMILGDMPREEGKGKSNWPPYNKWGKVASTASAIRKHVWSSYKFTKEQLYHQQGDFVAIDHDIFFGGGQKLGSI